MSDGIVPKVTAFDETSALWALMRGDHARAREIVAGMTPSERADFEGHLSVLMDFVWSHS